MKTRKFLFLILAVLLCTSSCFSLQRIQGDGNVVTEVINIEDYDVLQAENASMKIVYRQSDETPALTITTDKNIIDMYDIRVENKTLRITPKNKYKLASFSPTEFTVITNSITLRKLDAAGIKVFDLDSPLSTDNLKISLAGSGTVNLNDSVSLNKLDIDLAGSGTLNALSLYGNEFNSDIAGSGKLNLGGMMQKASFDIAGSGKIHAFDLQVEDMKCDIAGSGNIEIRVNNGIHADIAGSGKIKYKGNPQNIKKNVAGSGSIQKVD